MLNDKADEMLNDKADNMPNDMVDRMLNSGGVNLNKKKENICTCPVPVADTKSGSGDRCITCGKKIYDKEGRSWEGRGPK